MILNLKGIAKNKATYTGAAASVRFALATFPNKTAPATLEVADGIFAPAVEKVAKVKTPKVALTPEERAARKANRPQLTLAEKVAKQEAKLARYKAKVAKEAAEASGEVAPPATDAPAAEAATSAF